MTQAEFIAYAQLNPTQVNIWYTETEPDTILCITVPTIDFTGQNIVALLDQIQQIIAPVEVGGNVLDITLDVLTTQLCTNALQNFYFFTVTPYIIGAITNDIFITQHSYNGEDLVFTTETTVSPYISAILSVRLPTKITVADVTISPNLIYNTNTIYSDK